MADDRNQPPPFTGVNLFAGDRALKEAVDREGGSAHTRQLIAFGAWARLKSPSWPPPRIGTCPSCARTIAMAGGSTRSSTTLPITP